MKRLSHLSLMSIAALTLLLVSCNKEQQNPFFLDPVVSGITIDGDTVTITGDGFFQVEPGSALPGNLTISVCGETVGNLVLNGETKTVTFAPGSIVTITTATKVVGKLTGEFSAEHTGVRITNPDGQTINIDIDCDGEAPDDIDDEPAPQDPEEPESEPDPEPSPDPFQLTIHFDPGNYECETEEECVYVTPDSFDEEEPYTFLLPLTGTGTVTINWGDDETTTVTNPTGSVDDYTIPLIHDYAGIGPFEITVTGELLDAVFRYDYGSDEPIWLSDLNWSSRNFVISLDSWGPFEYRTLAGAFRDMTNLRTVPTYLPGSPTDLSQMFSGATNFNSDISGWDVSSVTNVVNMFAQTKRFNSDISGWDVSSIENMSAMFYAASAFDQNIGGWVTDNVSDMSAVFYSAKSFNQDLSNWDVFNVEDMGMMFGEATSFNMSLAAWCVPLIHQTPALFADNTGLTEDQYPQWGPECLEPTAEP